jgi:glycosyltransferase involved in cell wall biosynthesis
MRRVSRVLVVIPARDEEELLPRCLDALAAAVDEVSVERPGVVVRAVVVADRTTDGTHGIVTGHGRFDLELVAVEHGNVGAARRAGIDHLMLGGDHHATWIATTDADSIVPRDWLSKQLALAASGADVVVGTVVPEYDGLTSAQVEAWQRFHELPDPTGDIHGANLGIRASVYLTLGGFRAHAVGEDVDLVRRAMASGYRALRSTGRPVITSSRADGRAPDGYASWLHRSGGLMAESDAEEVDA